MSKKLVFFGTDTFSSPSLKKLISSGWEISYVVTKPNSRAGRGLKQQSPLVKQIAEKNAIEVLQPVSTIDIKAELKASGADTAVLVAYGKILPSEIINCFKNGIINVHPSLLPKYRGPSPVEAAILGGDSRTGVSIMKLSEKMDAGPIYAQAEVKLTGQEYKLDLSERLAELGAEMLASNLESIIEGSLKAHPQNEAEASYCRLIHKVDGLIDWSEPAELIQRKVRAYEGFPKVRAQVFDKYDVIVLRSTIVDTHDDNEMTIACHPGFIRVDQLVAPSGRIMSGKDFLRGYKA